MGTTTAQETIPRKPAAASLDVDSIIAAYLNRLTYSVAREAHTATTGHAFQALAMSVRDRIIERWYTSQESYYTAGAKRVYYLSLEFLLGRLLMSNIISLGAEREYAEAMRRLGMSLEDIAGHEPDAGLGNGGLGRLAACFLDSAATLSIPFYGYGIRYEFGMFRQEIVDGEQREEPDAWLQYGNPWEIARPDVLFPVKFYGRVEEYADASGRKAMRWVGTEDVYAMAYDILIPGFRSGTVNSLRLWGAKSTRDFDLGRFNSGEYVGSVEDKFRSENISKVLYPTDAQYAGRELRLKQQYFFTSATIQDVVRRFKKGYGRRPEERDWKWHELPERVAIQLNDTHPAIAIPEMMRILVDAEGLDWEESWWICEHVFGYTNHTVMPEALESWPVDLVARLLPRHMQIIEEIDRRWRSTVSQAYPGDDSRVKKMSIVNDFTHNVRMANLAIVGSHAVNGVARLHTDILKASTFPEFHAMFPRKFSNKTNGVTHRRWLLQANPELASLITSTIGESSVWNLDLLRQLERYAEDASFVQQWQRVWKARKRALEKWLRRTSRIELDPDSLFDIQAKRMHEYKRQLLNVMHVISLYHRILDGDTTVVPRTVIFAGKAAPSYHMAKLIIALIHRVGKLVAARPEVAKLITVHFVPDYGVSAAEMLFPATDLSEQISTAGMEASGTGCMKAVLNGAAIIGTLDGANVEIAEEVGAENMFIFGHTVEQINGMREKGYSPQQWIEASPMLRRVIETIGKLDNGRFREIAEILSTSDRYFHCADFDMYVEAQKRAAATWTQRDDWARLSIMNTARSSRFSVDRTVREYARDIWKVETVPVEP